MLVHAHGRTQIEFLRLFNNRIDHVGLLAGLELGADELEGPRAVLLRQEARLNGCAVGWQLVNYGEVQVAIKRKRQRARNRRGGHDQYVRRWTLTHQRIALQDTEPVLFVHDHQPELGELHVFFNQGVRPDHQVDGTGGHLLLQGRLLARLARADQKLDIVGRIL